MCAPTRRPVSDLIRTPSTATCLGRVVLDGNRGTPTGRETVAWYAFVSSRLSFEAPQKCWAAATVHRAPLSVRRNGPTVQVERLRWKHQARCGVRLLGADAGSNTERGTETRADFSRECRGPELPSGGVDETCSFRERVPSQCVGARARGRARKCLVLGEHVPRNQQRRDPSLGRGHPPTTDPLPSLRGLQLLPVHPETRGGCEHGQGLRE